MKKLCFGILSTACAMNIAHAQSSVTLYGIIDEAIRYDTHQTQSGGKLFTMGSGAAELSPGSRAGVCKGSCGSETWAAA